MIGMSGGSKAVRQRAMTAPSDLSAFLSDYYNIVEFSVEVAAVSFMLSLSSCFI